MWRVIKGMYDRVQSSQVLVGDEQTEMFDLFSGVRQGCVMSPVLFLFHQWAGERDQRENTRSL